MFTGLCYSGNWGSFGYLGGSGWIGLILGLVFWLALIAGLTLLVVLALRRNRANAAEVPDVIGRPTTKEILQARYARGEISREQYNLLKQDIG